VESYFVNLEKCNDKFKSFLRNLNEKCSKIDSRTNFFSLLIEPVQRPCRIQLLFEELVKTATPGTHCHQEYSNFLKNISNVVESLNEDNEIHDKLQQITLLSWCLSETKLEKETVHKQYLSNVKREETLWSSYEKCKKKKAKKLDLIKEGFPLQSEENYNMCPGGETVRKDYQFLEDFKFPLPNTTSQKKSWDSKLLENAKNVSNLISLKFAKRLNEESTTPVKSRLQPPLLDGSGGKNANNLGTNLPSTFATSSPNILGITDKTTILKNATVPTSVENLQDVSANSSVIVFPDSQEFKISDASERERKIYFKKLKKFYDQFGVTNSAKTTTSNINPSPQNPSSSTQTTKVDDTLSSKSSQSSASNEGKESNSQGIEGHSLLNEFQFQFPITTTTSKASTRPRHGSFQEGMKKLSAELDQQLKQLSAQKQNPASKKLFQETTKGTVSKRSTTPLGFNESRLKITDKDLISTAVTVKKNEFSLFNMNDARIVDEEEDLTTRSNDDLENAIKARQESHPTILSSKERNVDVDFLQSGRSSSVIGMSKLQGTRGSFSVDTRYLGTNNQETKSSSNREPQSTICKTTMVSSETPSPPTSSLSKSNNTITTPTTPSSSNPKIDKLIKAWQNNKGQNVGSKDFQDNTGVGGLGNHSFRSATMTSTSNPNTCRKLISASTSSTLMKSSINDGSNSIIKQNMSINSPNNVFVDIIEDSPTMVVFTSETPSLDIHSSSSDGSITVLSSKLPAEFEIKTLVSKDKDDQDL